MFRWFAKEIFRILLPVIILLRFYWQIFIKVLIIENVPFRENLIFTVIFDAPTIQSFGHFAKFSESFVSSDILNRERNENLVCAFTLVSLSKLFYSMTQVKES